MLKQVLLLLFCGVVVIGLSACDSNGGDEDEVSVPERRFTMELSGDVETTFEGFAYFGVAEDPETREESFAIVFSGSEQVNMTGAWASIARQAGQPGEGQHAFANIDGVTDTEYPADQFGFWVYLPEERLSLVSTSGTLTITESDDDDLVGTFEVEATGFQLSGQQQEELSVVIEGSFDAFSPDDLVVPSY